MKLQSVTVEYECVDYSGLELKSVAAEYLALIAVEATRSNLCYWLHHYWRTSSSSLGVISH